MIDNASVQKECVQMKRLIAVVLAAFAVLAVAGPAGAIRQFIVFFAGVNPTQLDPVQWHIGAEGDAVIAEAAAADTRSWPPGARIRLIAGDQRVGTLETSVERSRKRAEAVKSSLVKYGVPAASVVIHACGFRRYLVETPPDTREPMNRFVALDIAPLHSQATDVCAQQ